MFLSEAAKKLLVENRFDELQALALEELIPSEMYAEFKAHCEKPLEALPIMGSVPTDLADPISLAGIVDAVVVSSGHIYSRAMIEGLIAATDAEADVICPRTREVLKMDYVDAEGVYHFFVPLPQVDAAIGYFRQSLNIETTISELEKRAEVFNLTLKVSRNKLRLLIEPKDGSAPAVLSDFLRACLPDPRSDVEGAPKGAGYLVEGYGRCWHVLKTTKADHARAEFWYPLDTLSDDDVNKSIAACLEPLKLPAVAIPPGVESGSIVSLDRREYRSAFPAMPVSAALAARCCKNFLAHAENLTISRGAQLNDVVAMSTDAPTIAKQGGLMFFGAPLAGAAHVDCTAPGIFSQTPAAAAGAGGVGPW